MSVVKEENSEVSITHQHPLSVNTSLIIEGTIIAGFVCLGLFHVFQLKTTNLFATILEILDVYPLPMYFIAILVLLLGGKLRDNSLYTGGNSSCTPIPHRATRTSDTPVPIRGYPRFQHRFSNCPSCRKS